MAGVEVQLIFVDFLASKNSWFHSDSCLRNEPFIMVFLPWKLEDISLFEWHENIQFSIGLSSPENELIFKEFLVHKTSWYSKDFQLISARFLGWNISLFQLNFVARKSTKFSSFYSLENHLNSACFIAKKITWIRLVFLTRKSTEFSSFSWLENQPISTHFQG